MKPNHYAPHLTPVIAAALRRRLPHAKGASARGDSKNNYVAEKPLSTGIYCGNRQGAGAPAGNRNAVTHGAYTADQRAFYGYERNLRRRVKLLLAGRRAALAAQGDGQ